MTTTVSTVEGSFDPRMSVVLNTYNRSLLVTRAIEAVLRQTYDDLELIVVDDGSSDDTAERIQTLSDPRLTYVYQSNAGLSAGRNNGASRSSGEWITFLDDDDVVEPGWLDEFQAVFANEIGMVFAGHKRVSTIDGSVRECLPEPMGAAFEGVRGGMLAGSWAMRRSLFDATGGFMTELPTLVQSEFLLRAIPACRQAGLQVRTIDSTSFRYSVTPGMERPTLTADLTIRAASMILDRHAEAFNRDRDARSSWNAVIGVAAARSGRWNLARSHFLVSAAARPWSAKNWARLVVSCSPGRGRVWRRQPPAAQL